MTQQEAYIKLLELIRQLEVLNGEARAIAKQYGLVYEVITNRGIPQTLPPQIVDGRHSFKRWDDMTLEEQQLMCEVLDVSMEDAEEYYAGRELYENWIPSRFCS